MFQLIGRELYRWDLDRKVKLSIYEAIDEVHVAKHGGDEALIVTPRKEKGMVVADIPNILLQTARKITVYAVKDGATIGSDTFLVKYKEKPSGYVYTETEVKTWTKLEERIGDIEKNSAETIKQAVNDYLKENPLEEKDPTVPEWAKSKEKPKYTASEVGALSEKELQSAIDTALTQAKESGEFKGDKGDKGDDGKTPAKGTDYFTEADKNELVTDVLNALPTWTGGSY